MKENYKNKQMTTDNMPTDGTKVVSKMPDLVSGEEYGVWSFPEHEISFKAKDIDEAYKKLAEYLKNKKEVKDE